MSAQPSCECNGCKLGVCFNELFPKNVVEEYQAIGRRIEVVENTKRLDRIAEWETKMEQTDE